MDHVEALPANPGARCVQAMAHVDRGQGMLELNETLCAKTPDPNNGMYQFVAFFAEIPVAYADQERATRLAVMNSFQWDEALVQQRVNAMMAPILADMRRRWQDQENALIQRSQQIADGIRQTGQRATMNMQNREAMNDAQHASFNQQEDDIGRRAAGFSNYILDQTVIRDTQDPDNTHYRTWNRTADSLMRANPDRVVEVPQTEYIKGTDFF